MGRKLGDPKLDHDSDKPQVKANQEECMAKPTHTDLINSSTIAPTDLDTSNEEDQLQSRLNKSIQTLRNQEETMKNITTIFEQNRNEHFIQQNAGRPPSCQPTLRAIERLAWCVFEHGISKNGISRHGILSQDLELAWRVLIEPKRPAPRSCVRLTFDNG